MIAQYIAINYPKPIDKLVLAVTVSSLVIGGDSDRVVGQNSSEEIAEKISGRKLVIFKGFGHMSYGEDKDFNSQVLGFLNE